MCSTNALSGSIETNQGLRYYGALNLGVMQATFHVNANMLDNSFPANISADIEQQAFNGGLLFGFVTPINDQFLWGVDLTVAGSTGNALLQDASTQISDNIASRFNIDLDLNGSVRLAQHTSAFLKFGPSATYVQDTVSSPSGFAATYVSTDRNALLAGLNLGLGIYQGFANSLFVFAEYDYHHFPTRNMPNFNNYASTYSHTISLSNNTLSVGIGKNF